jgi:hypothetical protein
MSKPDDDDDVDLCPCSEAEAAAALSLIVARVLAMDADPMDIVVVRRDLGGVTEWQVEHRPKRKVGN